MTWAALAIVIFAAAWVAHTDESRAYALDIVGAFLDIGMSHKEASIEMRLTDEAELSKQLAGTKPLNAFRLSFLPSGFHVALLRRIADRYGAAVIAPEDLALIRGAAVLGPERVAQLIPESRRFTRTVTLPLGRQEQVA
jgi:hypothetical protein